MGAVNDIHLRKSPAADQAIPNEFAHHLSHILHGNIWVDAVQIVKVGIVGLESIRRSRQVCLHNVFQSFCGNFCGVQVQFCRQNDILAEVMNGFTNDALLCPWFSGSRFGPYASAVSKKVQPKAWALRIASILYSWFGTSP